MKRFVWIVPCLLALAACVDSRCPEGSMEVAGKCQSIESVESGDGGMPDDGGDRDAGEPPGRDANTEDAEADASQDADGVDTAMVEPCDLLSCGDNAHCEDVNDEANCVCDEGFEGDGTTCEVDPCADDPCDAATSACKNEDGTAVCECLEGLARCDGDAYACTTDLRNDAAHCGACGAACAGNLECAEGACEQKVVRLSLGMEHSCALAPDGEILCWGSDDDDQLQHANRTPPDHEPGVTTIGKARVLSANVATNCALMQNDDFVCWGSNDPFSWLASGAQRGVFRFGSGFSSVESVATGNLAVCIVVDGQAECWGIAASFDPTAQVLQYSFPNRKVIVMSSDVVQLSTGYQTCAVTTAHDVRCWGYDIPSPEVIEDARGPLEDVEQVSVSSFTGTTCAVLADGRIMCWGINDAGQLGNVGATGARATQAVPVTDQSGTPLRDFVQVAVATSHGCGRTRSGTVMCWGQSNRLGNAGSSSAAQRYASQVRDIDDAIDLAAGAGHTCVRRRSGQVQCWGDNSRGQLGVARLQLGGIASSTVPVNVVGLP